MKLTLNGVAHWPQRRRGGQVAALAAGILAIADGASAREYAPRVLSPHNADAYSMKTFAQFERWRNLEGDAKAYEVFKYLADTQTGIYPMGAGAWEGRDAVYDYGFIRDPVKMINVYARGYCDMLGPTMAGVMQDMGIGPSRTVNIPGWGHVVAEVSYGGKWHYLDLDVRAAFRRGDGTLASVADSKTEDALWERPNSPLFFPLDKLPAVKAAYQKSALEYRYGVNMGGHTMDFVLRRGETFTRWWKPQGDRWSHHESYNKPNMLKLIEREPRGPKGKHVSFSIHARGNGLFKYRPDLSAKSDDFADGACGASNVTPGPSGLTLDKAGDGFAVFEVRTPYVIVPAVGDPATTDDDKEASVVKATGSGMALAVSLDNGLTWKGVTLKDGMIDLTKEVARTYGYLLKVKISGEPGQALLRTLEIATWVEVHPASLPGLRKGTNVMSYVTGDHYGLPSRVLEIRTNGSDRDDFLKYCSEPPADFDPNRKTARAKGPFVVKVEAPPGAKIAWFSGGGNFCTHQQGAAPNTKNAMAWAPNEPKDFKEFYRADVPAGQNHWHYNADVEVKLDLPVRKLFLRYVGDPGVNNLRIYAHCLGDKPPASGPVVITHAWIENGAHRKKTVTLDHPGPYEVVAEGNPVDESVEIAVPGGAKR